MVNGIESGGQAKQGQSRNFAIIIVKAYVIVYF